jgi:hypothetical protein
MKERRKHLEGKEVRFLKESSSLIFGRPSFKIVNVTENLIAVFAFFSYK